MKKLISEKGIALIYLIIIILIIISIISITLKITFENTSKGATSKEEKDLTHLIGQTVSYIPEKGKYEINPKIVGNNENTEAFVTDETIEWQIWKITDETVTLISSKPTSIGGYKNIGALNLSDCTGYNNGVAILNEICKTCYSNKEIGAVARSLSIDDIEEVLDKTKWAPETYKAKKTNAQTNKDRKEYKNTIYYPSLYQIEQNAIIDGIEIEEAGLKKSEQETLSNITDTFQKAEKTITPMQTAWTNGSLKEENYILPAYYKMLYTPSSYHLASRAIDLKEDCINFGLFELTLGKTIQTTTLFNSRGASQSSWNRIRPIVEIPRTNFEL